MAFSKTNSMQVRQASWLSMLVSLVLINTFILGTLGLALCFLSVLTDTQDAWLGNAFVLSIGSILFGYMLLAIRRKRRRKYQQVTVK
ncbi:hypothetical protein [Glaciecola sp. 1036]|uniref:hypothetical protein n=1 Tax=Alteromonadaceae TaxID=72275 RepID=UPI003CFFFF8C